MTVSVVSKMWLNEHVAQSGKITIDEKSYLMPAELPNNERAERAVLAALLIAGAAGDGLNAMRRIAYLRYDDFYIYRHGIIFRAMERLFIRGQETAVEAVVLELASIKNKNGTTMLDTIGGEEALVQLINAGSLNVDTYARMVIQSSLYRATVAVGTLMVRIGDEARLELEELAHELNLMITDIGIRINAINGRHTHELADVIVAHLKQFKADTLNEDFEAGIQTGFNTLTEKLLGWRKKKLYVIAGSTGMGKSAFLLSSALANYQAGKRVLFVSLELPLDEILDRLVCNLASVDNTRFQTRTVTPDEMDRIDQVTPKVEKLKADVNFTIVCLNHPTLVQLNNCLDDLMLNNTYDVLFIDYIGWNTIADGGKHRGNTVAHTGDLWNTVNDWKKDYDVPVIAGCQISRDHEKRKDKHPMLRDLSDSSMIEKNADAVIFLFRPEKYDKAPDYPGRAEAIVAKNRSGKGGDKVNGTAYIMSELHFNRFSEWNGELNDQVQRDLDWTDL